MTLEIRLVFEDRGDTLEVADDGVESIVAVLPMLAEVPYFARFLVRTGLVDGIGATTARKALSGAQEAPGATQAPSQAPGTVRRVTAAEVVAAGPRGRSNPPPAADDALAGPGLRRVLENKGLAYDESVTIGQAKALIAQAKAEGGE